MKKPEDLTAVEITALQKLFTPKAVKAARNDVEPGNHKVKFSIDIEGVVAVGEDFEQDYPIKIDFIGLFAFALNKLNVRTREAIIRFYEEAGEITQREFSKEVETIIKELVGKTKQERKGNVKVNTVVTKKPFKSATVEAPEFTTVKEILSEAVVEENAA